MLHLCLQKVILIFEEFKGNNYMVVSVLALYHQICLYKKEIISNVQISFLLTSFKISMRTHWKKWFSEVKNNWQSVWLPSWILAAILIFTLGSRSKSKCLVMTCNCAKLFACRIIRTIFCHNTLTNVLYIILEYRCWSTVYSWNGKKVKRNRTVPKLSEKT